MILYVVLVYNVTKTKRNLAIKQRTHTHTHTQRIQEKIKSIYNTIIWLWSVVKCEAEGKYRLENCRVNANFLVKFFVVLSCKFFFYFLLFKFRGSTECSLIIRKHKWKTVYYFSSPYELANHRVAIVTCGWVQFDPLLWFSSVKNMPTLRV